MKTWQIYILMGLAGCMVILQAWNTYALSHFQEKTASRSPIYEYREITANGIDEDYSKYNAWIKDGWEPLFLLKTDGVDKRYLMRRLKR